MRISQVCTFFYPFRGGVETYVYHLSRELVRIGDEVTVFCANYPEGRRVEEVDGITVRRVPMVGRISFAPLVPTLPCYLLGGKADLFHAHSPTPMVPESAAIAAKLEGKPLVLTYHNDVTGGTPILDALSNAYNRFVLPFALNSADSVITTTRAYPLRSGYLRPYLEKIRVIPSGVDAERFNRKVDGATVRSRIGSSGKIILFVGFLNEKHRYKGVDYLLHAFRLVLNENPKTRLVIVGRGELEAEYRLLAKKLGISGSVVFTSYVPDGKLPAYYSACDVFVLPSISEQEGFGIVALEAMACGKPVVTTSAAGVSEFITEDCGLICKPRDVNGLAEKIAIALDKRYSGRKISEIAAGFAWDSIARKVRNVYLSLLQG